MNSFHFAVLHPFEIQGFDALLQVFHPRRHISILERKRKFPNDAGAHAPHKQISNVSSAILEIRLMVSVAILTCVSGPRIFQRDGAVEDQLAGRAVLIEAVGHRSN